jgi:hypothetical protein
MVNHSDRSKPGPGGQERATRVTQLAEAFSKSTFSTLKVFLLVLHYYYIIYWRFFGSRISRIRSGGKNLSPKMEKMRSKASVTENRLAAREIWLIRQKSKMGKSHESLATRSIRLEI